MGQARARPRVGRRSERAGRPARLGAAALRLPLRASNDRARQGAARARRRPERVLRERVREHVRALRRRGSQARPGADASAARGRRESRTTASPLYHSTEAESPECVRILLEHGAQTADTNALAHALDNDRLEHVRLLLEHGFDPNEIFRRACRPAWSRAGDDRAPGLARRRCRPAGRRDLARRRATPHSVSARRPARKGRPAELLARLGASTEVDPADAAVASIARGERPHDAATGDVGPRRAGGARSFVAARQARPRARRRRAALQRRRRRLTGRDAAPPRRWVGSPESSSGCSSSAPTRWRVPTSTRRSPGRHTAPSTTTLRTGTTLASRSGSSRRERSSSRASSRSRRGRSPNGFRA